MGPPGVETDPNKLNPNQATSMNSDQIPTEIWSEIFGHACTDDGTTGRSLSLVSSTFSEISRRFKYQSISIKRTKHVLHLAEILSAAPENDRKVKYLFIACPPIFFDATDEEEEEERVSDADTDEDESGYRNPGWGGYKHEKDPDRNYRPPKESDDDSDKDEGDESAAATDILEDLEFFKSAEWEERGTSDESEVNLDALTEEGMDIIQEALQRILKAVAPTLRILTILFEEEFLPRRLIPISVALPSLVELTVSTRRRLVDATDDITDSSIVFPSLRYLHIAGNIQFWPETPLQMIPKVAPSLTHLRAPCHPQNILLLPPTIERVLMVETWNTYLTRAIMRIKNAMVVRDLEEEVADFERYWRERIAGGIGVWRYDARPSSGRSEYYDSEDY